MNQPELIDLYSSMELEKEQCSHPPLWAHYDHILLGLQKLIESHGPCPEFKGKGFVQLRPSA